MKQIILCIMLLLIPCYMLPMEQPDVYDNTDKYETEEFITVENRETVSIELKSGHIIKGIPLIYLKQSEILSKQISYEQTVHNIPIYIENITLTDFCKLLLSVLEIISTHNSPVLTQEQRNSLLQKLTSHSVIQLCKLLNICSFLAIEKPVDLILHFLAQKITDNDELTQFITNPNDCMHLLYSLEAHFLKQLEELLCIPEVSKYMIKQPKKFNPITLVDSSEWQCATRFNYEGNCIACASNNNMVRIWDCKTGSLLHAFKHNADHSSNCQHKEFSICFSPTDNYIASGTSEKKVKLWDIGSEKLIREFVGHTDWVHTTRFSPNGKYIASASNDKTVKVWDIDKENLKIDTDPVGTFLSFGWIYSIRFSPNSRYLACLSDNRPGSNNISLKIWDLETSQLLDEKKHSDWIYTLQFSPDSRFIISASADKTAKIWSLDNLNASPSILKHSGEVNSAWFSHDGALIATSSGRSIKIWNAHTKELLHSLNNSGKVSALCFSFDSNYLASGSWDKTVKIWTTRGKLLYELKHDSPVNSVCFSPNNNYLLCKLAYGHIKLWDINVLTEPIENVSLEQELLIYALENDIADLKAIERNKYLKKIFKSFNTESRKKYIQNKPSHSQKLQKLIPKYLGLGLPAYLFGIYKHSEYGTQKDMP